MVTQAAKKIIELLDSHIQDHDIGNPYFSGKGYIAYPFEEKNFRPVVQSTSRRRLAFIDGGNMEVLRAPNFSIQVNRVYYCIFQGTKRVVDNDLPQRIEFFSATYSTFKDGGIYYDTFILPVRTEFKKFLPKEKDLSVNSLDRTIRIGDMRADISRAASLARRFAEWEFARHVIARELQEKDVIVTDGTLQTTYSNEWKYAKRAFATAKRKDVIFTGMAKTSNLYTTTGLSLLGVIQKFARDLDTRSPTWYYYPVAEVRTPVHEASIFAVKLSQDAERIFRFEIYRDQAEQLTKENMDEIFGELSKNSSDIAFPGYPYGLMVADANARVRREEVERYQMLLLSEISKQGKWLKFALHIRASDAHDVLNMLMG